MTSVSPAVALPYLRAWARRRSGSPRTPRSAWSSRRAARRSRSIFPNAAVPISSPGDVIQTVRRPEQLGLDAERLRDRMLASKRRPPSLLDHRDVAPGYAHETRDV